MANTILYLNSMSEVESLVRALALAVDMDFMAREHAALLWKTILQISDIDIVNKKQGGNKNVTTKES